MPRIRHLAADSDGLEITPQHCARDRNGANAEGGCNLFRSVNLVVLQHPNRRTVQRKPCGLRRKSPAFLGRGRRKVAVSRLSPGQGESGVVKDGPMQPHLTGLTEIEPG